MVWARGQAAGPFLASLGLHLPFVRPPFASYPAASPSGLGPAASLSTTRLRGRPGT